MTVEPGVDREAPPTARQVRDLTAVACLLAGAGLANYCAWATARLLGLAVLAVDLLVLGVALAFGQESA